MKIADQLNFIADKLAAWAATSGGKCFIAADEVHLMELLFLGEKPGAVRVILCVDAEAIRGDPGSAEANCGLADRQFKAVISRGRGYKADPGQSLVKPDSAGQPLYSLVEQARDVIRTLMLDAAQTERPVAYQGWQKFDTGDLLSDAVQINFSIGTQIGLVTPHAVQFPE